MCRVKKRNPDRNRLACDGRVLRGVNCGTSFSVEKIEGKTPSHYSAATLFWIAVMKLIFSFSVALLALGCGKSDSSTDSAEDTSSTSCTRSGYAINDAYGDLEEGGEEGWIVTAENWDLSSGLMIESWSEFDGPTEAGVYDLAGTNYEDCALCLLICYQFDGERCESFFYADEGTVEIERIDVSEGGEVELSLSGVVFKEVTINNNYVSTPVEGGETWCVDSEESISASFQ